MSIGHKAVIQVAHVLAAMGLDLVSDPNLLSSAKAEFDKRTGGKAYKSINVDKTPPGRKMDLEHRHHFDCVIHSAMEHFGIEEPAS